MSGTGLRVIPGPLPGPLLIHPTRHYDARGSFEETFNARDFAAATGLSLTFVQDNAVRSARGVLRGLHFQQGAPQGKLVRVVSGAVFDVVVDLRRGSPTYGEGRGCDLDADGPQLWVPPGFAHGYLVCSETAEVAYKVTTHREPSAERALQPLDPALGVDWPDVGPIRLAPRDAAAPRLSDCPGLVAD